MVPSSKNDGFSLKTLSSSGNSKKTTPNKSVDKKKKSNANKRRQSDTVKKNQSDLDKNGDDNNDTRIAKDSDNVGSATTVNEENIDQEKFKGDDSIADPSSFSGKHRLRISKACDICRKKKTKCNGLSPCSNCIKGGLDCIYDMTVPKRKHRQVTKLSSVKKTSTTTKGIIKDMDNKINRLEFLLGSLINNMNKHNNNNKDYIPAPSSNLSSYPTDSQDQSFTGESNAMLANSNAHSKDIYKNYMSTTIDNAIHLPTGMLSHTYSDSESSDSSCASLSDDDSANLSMKNVDNEGTSIMDYNTIDGNIAKINVKDIKMPKNHKNNLNRRFSTKINSDFPDLSAGIIDEDDDIINDEELSEQADTDNLATNNHPLTSNMEIFSSKLSPLVLSRNCFKWAGEKAFRLSKGGSDGYMLKYSFQKSVFAFRNHFRKQLVLPKESHNSAPNNPFDLFPDNSFFEKLIQIFLKVEMFETFVDPNDIQIIKEKFYNSRLPNSKKKLSTGEYLILTMICTFSTYLISVADEKISHKYNKDNIDKPMKSDDNEKFQNNEAKSKENANMNGKSDEPLKDKSISAKEMKRYEQMFFRFALTLYQKAVISTPTLDCVKGILLVALFFEGCSLSVSYAIISTGVRICEELNLHLMDSYKHLSKYEVLKRKMVWLIFYILDKNACMLTLKPPAINDKYSTTFNNEDFKLEMIRNFSIDDDNRQYFNENPISFYLSSDYEFMKEFNRYCLHNEYGFRYLSMFTRMIIASIEQKMYDVLLSPTSTIKFLMKKTMDANLIKEDKLKIFRKIQQKFDYLNKKLDDCESLLSIYGSQDSNRSQDICKISGNYPCSSEITNEYRKCALMTFHYWYHSNRMNLNRFGCTLLWTIEERRYRYAESAIDSALTVLKLCTRYYDLFLVLKNCFTLYILSSFFTIVTHVINLIYMESKNKNPKPENQEKIIQYIIQLVLTESNYFETIEYVEDTFKDHIRYWTCRMIMICLILLEDDEQEDKVHINLSNVLKNVNGKENYRDILQKFLDNNESFCENYVTNNIKKMNNERDKQVAKKIKKENQSQMPSKDIGSSNDEKQKSLKKMEIDKQNIQSELLGTHYNQNASYTSNIDQVNPHNLSDKNLTLSQQSLQKQVRSQQEGVSNSQPHPIIINQMQQQQMLKQQMQHQQLQVQQQLQQFNNQYNSVNGQQQMYDYNSNNGKHPSMMGVLSIPQQQQQQVPGSLQYVPFIKGETDDMKMNNNIATSSIPYRQVYLSNTGNNENLGASNQHQGMTQLNAQPFYGNHAVEYSSPPVQPPHEASGNSLEGAFGFDGNSGNFNRFQGQEYFGNGKLGNGHNMYETSIFNEQFATLVHGVSDDFANGNQEYYFYNMGNPENFAATDLIGNRANNQNQES